MSDLVRIPEDQFSQNEAHIVLARKVDQLRLNQNLKTVIILTL